MLFGWEERGPVDDCIEDYRLRGVSSNYIYIYIERRLCMIGVAYFGNTKTHDFSCGSAI